MSDKVCMAHYLSSEMLMRKKILPFVVLCVMAIPLPAAAKTISIENNRLIVRYNDQAKTFSIQDKTTGAVFLKDGILDCATSSAKVNNQTIVVERTDGGELTLSLHKDS